MILLSKRKKLIFEDSSASSDESDVEPESDSSNGDCMPDFENVSDSSSDHCDDDSTNASRESATAYGGKGNRGKIGDAVRTRGDTEGAVGRGRGRGWRGCTVRDIGGTEGAGVQEGADHCSKCGKAACKKHAKTLCNDCFGQCKDQ